MKVATIVLNRNLPKVTDKICEHLFEYDKETDVFVVEAGSDDDKLSKYCSWHANWDTAREQGLRYNQGMNFGLSKLWKAGLFSKYEAFFLLTNDTELQEAPTVSALSAVLRKHPRVGLLSPCSKRWGELQLLQQQSVRYLWFIHNSAYMLRREFVEAICNIEQPDHMSFLFDGTNFRGYGSESEIIAKAYINDWAAAITSDVWAWENESHLLQKADLIKTESFADNQVLYLEEGKRWMRNKYGFNSRWSMLFYVKGFYESFFAANPEYKMFKI